MTYVKFKRNPFERSVNNMVDELFNGLPVMFNEGLNTLTKQGYTPVNIKETVNSYMVEVVAPGLEKNDFKINLDGNILTISAEKESEVKNDSDSNRNEKQIRREYNYHGFKRSFTIDEKIDATGIEASYVNGVLRLNLPKREEVKETSKVIEVK